MQNEQLKTILYEYANTKGLGLPLTAEQCLNAMSNWLVDTLPECIDVVSKTLPAGSEATVTLTGKGLPDDHYVFTFSIPQGEAGSDGTDGATGIGIFYISKTLDIDTHTELSLTDITVPSGYEVVVGSLILDPEGNLGQVDEILSDSEIEVMYLETLKNGGTGNTYRHNIAIYFNRDDMDCAAISFTLINESDSTSYTIPTGITYAVSGIVYPNSSTAQVATRLTTSTSGSDTIYTIGYWNYPEASQSTFNFTSNDDITIEHTVELLSTSLAGVTAGTGIDITDNTISVKTSSVALESESTFTYTLEPRYSISAYTDQFVYLNRITLQGTVDSHTWRGVVFIPYSELISSSTLGNFLYNYSLVSTATALPVQMYCPTTNQIGLALLYTTDYGSSVTVSFYGVSNIYGASEQIEITGVDVS